MPAVHGHKASSVEPYISGAHNRSPNHVTNNQGGGGPLKLPVTPPPVLKKGTQITVFSQKNGMQCKRNHNKF